MMFKRCGLYGAISAVALLFCRLSQAADTSQTVSLGWDADTSGIIAGYVIYYGSTSQNYTTRVDVGDNNQVTLSDFQPQSTNYFVIAAYDSSGNEGPPSSEISYVIPVALRLAPSITIGNYTWLQFPVMNGHWYEVQASTDLHNWTTIWTTPTVNFDGDQAIPDVYATNYTSRFYRLKLH